ncbi:putative RpiR family transcriptional regulator [Selenomonas ruminantium subsp. lactilytica TAM6421]|uniref:Putative RpiR family transcriptional regulator n=1 Tax=Selenomonas ruminantium subsp. lactilytica (strain NBRC 103574 / TAM6421) TaxID=927704 RepID=I0GS77_SELRL|nr:MurR/RpiR family transcriptional regulator [Selenomonas ruminantium]BAL83614.1 putative RpiR family transcriptional regulator [Selenomonas ruminantium subsp. lactilytica TAM6421]
MKLEELVNHNLSHLNDTDLIVWRYIYAHMQECCYISIYDLADACHVSRTTIMRFAKKLGFDGFSDLKAMLKLEQVKPQEKPSQNIAEATTALCKSIGEEIARQDFWKVNKLMYRAQRVFVFASGLVQRNIANELTRLFLHTNKYIFSVQGYNEFRTIMEQAGKQDLFIIISLSGEGEQVVDFAKTLHVKGVPLISMTRLQSNPLARLSTENLYVTPRELPAALGQPYESMLAFFLLVEIWFISYTQFLAEQDDTTDEDGV